MARTKAVFREPPWFDRSRYAGAHTLDAADWYLNLALRAALANSASGSWRRLVGNLTTRSKTPLLKRGAPAGDFLALVGGFDPAFLAILDDREPPPGVRPLRVDELYFFEKQLPDDVRDFGRAFVPGKSERRDAPADFLRTVDELFEPRMLGTFVRVDLSLPDHVLVRDLRDYLAAQRLKLARIGGAQPHRAAVGGRRKAKFATLATLQLLPYLDLVEWTRDSGARTPGAALARALGITWHDLRETRRHAGELMQPFVAHNWLIDAARAAMRKTSR